MKTKILVVDDDQEVRSLISGVLTDEGYETFLASNEQETIALLKNQMPHLVLLDLWIGDDESGGFKILDKLKSINPELPIIVISGHGTIDIAMQAMKKGAFDFIEKPFVTARLLLTCSRALEFHAIKVENTSLKNDRLSFDIFSIGNSPFAATINTTIDKIANSNSRVFIISPIGIGADSIAYRIHQHSHRKEFRFVSIDCFSIQDTEKFDAELFGTDNSYGYIEKATGGTLFLENIDRLPADTQRKFLMCIQNGKYSLGSRNVYCDFRIICSVTSLDKLKNFNKELFYRLKISEINIPSLSERREDIIPLINWYMERAGEFFRLKPKRFSSNALAILQTYDWPGNIHQIKNVVESSLINASNSSSTLINEEFLPSELTVNTRDKFKALNIANFITLPMKEAKERFEYDYLLAQVNRFSGNISQTANFIGMERSALHRKLKSLNVVYSKTSKNQQTRKNKEERTTEKFKEKNPKAVEQLIQNSKQNKK